MPTGPFQGPERLACISTLQFLQSAGNSSMETAAAQSGRRAEVPVRELCPQQFLLSSDR
eukprot:CAMPEP_0174293198 /NCGR_PEP_ID=MMETSP0809-20121228/37821_1 /TAXON_ID=73025 ORGANISM="Eutreptiella gymnastica-like, Strain CCMP1594" /NCGR_SAMPLE_ID=MMETSP0809 /ASSEMBLY_ACC=CAM_ASM_000658 /LENGTH=58 /DNA_ID=CAMNT_0015393801 /DNA_START=241 /DNA_END=413 /DNA_ORIENTATION=-